MNHKPLGSYGETLACQKLQRDGHRILARNFHAPGGEIDIVSGKNDTIYFCEVKTRTTNTFGKPWEAVDEYKIRKIRKAARAFITIRGLNEEKYYFEIKIISIKINHKPS